MIAADVTREEDRTRIVSRTLERFGGIDVLVNAAGIIGNGTIENTTLEAWDAMLDINLRSLFRLTQLALPSLVERKGNIVNVSSVTGVRAFPNVLAYCWVIDFPMFLWNEEEKRWDPSQHMFTMPMPEDVHMLESDPGNTRGSQYDMVCNGHEVGGGSMRIHDREFQKKIFPLIGQTMEHALEQFGHMLEAFEYGAPPHGGMAWGLDRLCAILAGEPNIREVIAFPKTQTGSDIMAGAPSEAEPRQLDELQIALNLKEIDGQ